MLLTKRWRRMMASNDGAEVTERIKADYVTSSSFY